LPTGRELKEERKYKYNDGKDTLMKEEEQDEERNV
jgi:hypothetical protein